MIRRLLLGFTLALLAPVLALAQSSPGLVYGQVPSAAQWNSYFAAKQDYSAAAITGPGTATAGHLLKWGTYPAVVDGGAAPTFIAGTGIGKTGNSTCSTPCTFSATSVGANPTAVVGLTAVNGVAATSLRSDGAPALDQSIVPTWTGTHSFSLIQPRTTATYDLGTSGLRWRDLNLSRDALIGGAVTATGQITASTTMVSLGAFTPAVGIVAVTTNSNACAGCVGEFVSSQVLVGSAVSLTTSTATTVTSISLSAGDWDVGGSLIFPTSVGDTLTVWYGWVSSSNSDTVTLAAASGGAGGLSGGVGSVPAGSFGPAAAISYTRFSLASTTTIYLRANATHTGGTTSAYGFIGARRAR